MHIITLNIILKFSPTFDIITSVLRLLEGLVDHLYSGDKLFISY